LGGRGREKSGGSYGETVERSLNEPWDGRRDQKASACEEGGNASRWGVGDPAKLRRGAIRKGRGVETRVLRTHIVETKFMRYRLQKGASKRHDPG